MPSGDTGFSTYNNQNWGIPHWRCSYFVFNRDTSVASAGNILQLANAISHLNPLVHGQPRLLTLTDDFDFDAMYVSAYGETYGNQNNLYPFTTLNITMASNLDTLLDNCETGHGASKTNQCITNPYADPTVWAALFGNRTVNTFIYYFEMLSSILPALNPSDSANNINVTLAPLGNPNSYNMPIYTDALVKSTRCAQPTGDLPSSAYNCFSTAQLFAEWYTSDAVTAWIDTSQDALQSNPNAPFRYVMPSTKSFFTYNNAIKNDRFFSALKNLVPTATNYITKGIDTDINNGDNLYNALLNYFDAQQGNF